MTLDRSNKSLQPTAGRRTTLALFYENTSIAIDARSCQRWLSSVSLDVVSSARSKRIFFRRVGEALSPYQLLEAFLKIYITRAHMRIRRVLGKQVPFHYPSAEYENAPLQRLIALFQRYTDNKALLDRLRSARKSRDYLAHRVIEDYMEHHEKEPKVASRISKDLKKLEDDGYNLVEELQKELRKLYDFDDFVREVL